MSSEVATTLEASEVARRVARLALLHKAPIDVRHGKLKHLRVVGFIVEPDEHWHEGEGAQMLEALQIMAGYDLKRLRDLMLERQSAPFVISPLAASDGAAA